ncbi:MAG TPA: SET domain-containing protein-lysine N-methyltransferase [Gammaproteobacteria bacterium]|nr:SET domain-containing protein-lysine N-methyltransferase [Gammaproteobacteria bacterium]
MKPEPLLNYSNPSHILYGNKPPLLGGNLNPMPLKKFEKKEKIIWINAPVTYRNTLLRLSKDPDNYDKNLICEFNDFAICEINATVGKGVFATKPIKAGTLIGMYAGILEVSTQGNYCSLYGFLCFAKHNKIFYYDAIQYRNMTGYVQHAPSRKEAPNAATANIRENLITQRGIPMCTYITTRDIEAYEQLLLDYGPYYPFEKPYQLFDQTGQVIK